MSLGEQLTRLGIHWKAGQLIADAIDLKVALASLTLTSWPPTLSASGGMTWTSTSVDYAKYFRIGNIVWFIIQARGTTGGTASNALRFTYPVANPTAVTGIACSCADGGAPIGGAWSGVSSTTGQVARYDNANFGLGAGRYLYAQGFYEVA